MAGHWIICVRPATVLLPIDTWNICLSHWIIPASTVNNSIKTHNYAESEKRISKCKCPCWMDKHLEITFLLNVIFHYPSANWIIVMLHKFCSFCTVHAPFLLLWTFQGSYTWNNFWEKWLPSSNLNLKLVLKLLDGYVHVLVCFRFVITLAIFCETNLRTSCDI